MGKWVAQINNKHKNKIIVLFAIVVILLIVVFASYVRHSNKNSIILAKSESYLLDYEIDDGYVYFYCTLKLHNITTQNQSFRIVGDFKDDFTSGLLSDRYLIAYDAENNTIFELDAEENRTFTICFKNKQKSERVNTKYDRLLPEISVEIID